MSAIDTLMGQPAAQAIGWALVHFVWQGTLVAILTAAALALLRTSAADVRYVVTTISLTLMFTLPAVTVTQMWTTNAGLQVGTTATAQPGLIPGPAATTARGNRDGIESGKTIFEFTGVTLLEIPCFPGCQEPYAGGRLGRRKGRPQESFQPGICRFRG